MGKDARVYLRMPGAKKGSSRGRPEIDRVRLREILVEGLPGGAVQWGRKVVRCEEVDEEEEEGEKKGRWTIRFADNTTAGPFGLVVGADGAWSRIRPLLNDAKPFYTGLSGLDMVIKDVAEREDLKDIDALVNRGSCFAFGEGRGLSLQQRGDGGLVVYAWFAKDETWARGNGANDKGFDASDVIAVEKLLEEEFGGWGDIFKRALKSTEPKGKIARGLSVLPIGHHWPARPGLTLIGDAAHLMTPFAGEGVNLAMTDAMKLADAIGDSTRMGGHGKILGNCVRAFEVEMFERAGAVARLSNGQMELMFFSEEGRGSPTHPGGPEGTVDRWVWNAVVWDLPWWVRWVVPVWLVRWVLRVVFWW